MWRNLVYYVNQDQNSQNQQNQFSYNYKPSLSFDNFSTLNKFRLQPVNFVYDLQKVKKKFGQKYLEYRNNDEKLKTAQILQDKRQNLKNDHILRQSIIALNAWFPNIEEPFQGTAFFYKKNPLTAITSAHCLLEWDQSKQKSILPRLIQVSLYKNGQEQKFIVKSFYTTKLFFQKKYQNDDFALIELEQYNQDQSNIKLLNVVSNFKIQTSKTLSICGYTNQQFNKKNQTSFKKKGEPSLKMHQGQTSLWDGKYQLKNNQQQKNVQIPNNDKKQFLMYNIQTTGGQSGSPILQYLQHSKQYQIIGIHYRKFDGLFNLGIRISSRILSKFNQWSADIPKNVHCQRLRPSNDLSSQSKFEMPCDSSSNQKSTFKIPFIPKGCYFI